jgi:hypothetical protein
MIAGLTEALASRRAIVDQEAETAEGFGSGTAGPLARGSKFAGVSFVEKSATGKTGLVNQGATCYLNSFVQMLCMTPDFCKPLFEWRHDPEQHGEERRCLALQLQKLLARLHLTSRGAVATTELTKSFGWEGSEAFVQHGETLCPWHATTKSKPINSECAALFRMFGRALGTVTGLLGCGKAGIGCRSIACRFQHLPRRSEAVRW